MSAVADPQAVAEVAAARYAGRRRGRLVVVGVGVVVVAIAFISLAVGDFPLGLDEVLGGLFGFGDGDARFVVGTLRLPRTIGAVVVGAAFGLSGAIFQSITGNTLASPDVIGITAGASVVAVAMIVLTGAGPTPVAVGAVMGGLAVAALIYGLAWVRGVSPYRLVLIGIGVAAMCTAATGYLLVVADIYSAQQATVWLTGSLNGTGWSAVALTTTALVLLAPVVVVLHRSLEGLQLGDHAARGLGIPVEGAKAGLVVAAVLLAALGVAAAGPVAFVAFAAAPIARRLAASSPALLTSAAMGAVILVASDLVARRLFAPTELPVGVVTGVIGGPYLLWLLARLNRSGVS